ncbi:hypothetical protein ACWF94_18195 [Streptomyces sp. NPDC055078]
MRESYLKLYAPTPDSVDILYVFNLRGETQSKAGDDSRVRCVFAQWSACMKKNGYEVSDPTGVASQLGCEDAALSSPAAITTAKADVACKKKVNLVGVAYAVESAYQQRLVDKNAETLQLVRKQAERRIRLAASLTGG